VGPALLEIRSNSVAGTESLSVHLYYSSAALIPFFPFTLHYNDQAAPLRPSTQKPLNTVNSTKTILTTDLKYLPRAPPWFPWADKYIPSYCHSFCGLTLVRALAIIISKSSPSSFNLYTKMPGPGGSRKSHTKSRKGCKTCKRRHIRCDENFPQWYVNGRR